MSKYFFSMLAGGLFLACSVGAYAADGYSGQNGNQFRGPAPPVQSPEQGAAGAGPARRFYSYQPPAVRGQRYVITPFSRPASAKALGNY